MLKIASSNQSGSNPSFPIDIEDIAGGTKSVQLRRPVVHSRKGCNQLITTKRNDNNNADNTFENDRIELKSGKNDFHSWLTQKKKAWRQSRQERKLIRSHTDREALCNQVGPRIKPLRSTLADFVREASLDFNHKEWQIVELREITSYDTGKKIKSSSGGFIAWVMMGDTLRKIQISVPRTIYISSNREILCDEEANFNFRKVDKHLPHNKKSLCLYQLTMSEFVYRHTNWTSKFFPSDKKINGHHKLFEEIYEAGTPLMTTIISELGCVAKLGAVNKSKKNDKSYNLKDLKMVQKPTEA
jgi:hypothetical protein